MTDQDDNLPNETLNDAPGELDVESVAYDPTPLSFDEFDQLTASSAETSREVRPEVLIDVDSTAVSLDDAPALGVSDNANPRDVEGVREVKNVEFDANSSANVNLSDFLNSTGNVEKETSDDRVNINLHIESVVKDGKPKRKKKRPRSAVERAMPSAETPPAAAPVSTGKSASPWTPPATEPVATPNPAQPIRLELPEAKSREPYEFDNPLENDLPFPPKSARSIDAPSADADGLSPDGAKTASKGVGGCFGIVLFITAVFCFISPKVAAGIIPIAALVIIAILVLSSSKNSS
ncbi:MAG: hypothetical protein IJU03_04220 [Thermoguttaceae bacterium]|nr:hypothetical protein [Thermoguttaceae bacterium]